MGFLHWEDIETPGTTEVSVGVPGCAKLRMNYVFLDFYDVAIICILMHFSFSNVRFARKGKAHLTFLTVYKLINGIFNSVHRLAAGVNTGMDETIR